MNLNRKRIEPKCGTCGHRDGDQCQLFDRKIKNMERGCLQYVPEENEEEGEDD